MIPAAIRAVNNFFTVKPPFVLRVFLQPGGLFRRETGCC